MTGDHTGMVTNSWCFVVIAYLSFTHLYKQLEPCDPLERKDKERCERQALNTWMLLQYSHGLPKCLVSLSRQSERRKRLSSAELHCKFIDHPCVFNECCKRFKEKMFIFYFTLSHQFRTGPDAEEYCKGLNCKYIINCIACCF